MLMPCRLRQCLVFLQGPRVTQTAVMSAVFFSLFEFWKSQLKRWLLSHHHVEMSDRSTPLCLFAIPKGAAAVG